MLMGEYSHTLDAKGRMIFPARLREELGGTFVVTRGLDNCLYVYSLAEWDKLSEKLVAQPFSKGSKLLRFMFSKAGRVEADKQGRILIPINLRGYAGIDKDVVVVGVGNHAEIWDKDKWAEFESTMDADDIAKAMDELGF